MCGRFTRANGAKNRGKPIFLMISGISLITRLMDCNACEQSIALSVLIQLACLSMFCGFFPRKTKFGATDSEIRVVDKL